MPVLRAPMRSLAIAVALAAVLLVPGLARAGHPHGAVPHLASSSAPAPAAASRTVAPAWQDSPPTLGSMSYHGGHVMHSTVIHTVYWQPSSPALSFDSSYKALIDTFAADVAHDSGTTGNVFAPVTQYTDSFTAHVTYGISFGGALVDTNPFPAPNDVRSNSDVTLACEASGDSYCLTDTQLANELTTFLTAHSQPSGFGDIYVLMLPSSVGVCTGYLNANGDDACSTNTFCAYHGYTSPLYNPSHESDPQYIYAIEPYYSTGVGCDANGNEANGSDADLAINTISHEVNEAITDPAFFGWYQNTNGDENGDKCAWNFGTILGTTAYGDYNQVINGGTYYLQREWSNAKAGCVQTAGPSIGTFSPADGAAATAVTITGTNFVSSAVNTVKFGMFTDPGFTVVSPTQITAHVPSGFATGKITVVSFAGTAVSTGIFSVPKVTGFTPLVAAAGATVTVTGLGLGSATVDFPGHTGHAVSAGAPSATSVKVKVPDDAIVGHLTVNTDHAAPITTTATFKPLPKITSISPGDGTYGQDVTIAGTNLLGVTSVNFGTYAAASFTTPTALSFHAFVPIPPFSSGRVTVLTPGGTAISPQTFVISKVTSFTPLAAKAGTVLTIAGQGLTGATVDFPGSAGHATPAPALSTATSLKVLVPNDATAGTLTVNTANAGSLPTVPQFKALPSVGGFNPVDGIIGTTVTITGANFNNCTCAVKFGVAPASSSYVDPTHLTATVPSGFTSGKITVTTANGTAVSTGTFFLSRVTSFSPASGAVGSTVTVSGAGLIDASSVDFGGGVSATPTNNTATSFRVVVPAGATPEHLVVHTPESPGTALTSAGTFNVTFSATGVSPTAATYGVDVTITGIGLGGVTAAGVKFNDNPAAAIVSNDGATLVVTTPATGNLNGPLTITKGTTTINAPSPFAQFEATSKSLNGGIAGDSVVIHGTGFGGVTDVTFGGTVADFTIDSSIQITAAVPDDAGGTGTLALEGTGGTVSAGSFTVGPAITGFTPGGGPVGTSVTITGTGFVNLQDVTFNGTSVGALPSYTPTQITVTVPDGATTGKILVWTPVGYAVSADDFSVQIAHSNGLDSNNYFDSSPLGTPGDASTYTFAMGDEARNSWGAGGAAVIATGLLTCGGAYAPYTETDTQAATWAIGGTLAGHVNLNTVSNTPTCPAVSDPTWN